MSDETNSAEVKVEAATEVAAEGETSLENFFDVIEAAPEKPVEPEKPEPTAEPASEDEFEYEGHRVRFSSAGECFIEKDGQCLGCAAGVVVNAEHAKSLIRVKESEKGE